MLSSQEIQVTEDTKELQAIKEMEMAGINVISIAQNGALEYATENGNESEYCDRCSQLRLLPDPDPFDWFRDGDMKAVCLEVNGVIAGALETREVTKIHKPLYCPKLGRELTEEEKACARITLKFAKERMEE